MPGLAGIFSKITDDFKMPVTSEQPWTGCEARRDAQAYMRRQTFKGCLNEAEEVSRYLPVK